ncbi:MAG: PQQ-dependent sugar dehydrogenase [Chloroflexi bacterium]|nr:PQQ-dependent sugar dehydrogenase [Chloroflexota bacterium]
MGRRCCYSRVPPRSPASVPVLRRLAWPSILIVGLVYLAACGQTSAPGVLPTDTPVTISPGASRPAASPTSAPIPLAATPTPTTATTALPAPSTAPAPTPTSTATPTPIPHPTPASTAIVTPTPLPALDVEVAFPGLAFPRMVFLTHSGDGADRLFLVLQPGRIMLLQNRGDVTSAEVFLDIRDRVNDAGSEEGLLGLTFDPQYASNGYSYVYYSASNPRRSVISRFSVRKDDPTRADPASESVILEVAQPFSNHNGGMIAFGPDGFFYIGLGDGGGGGDPFGNGQNLATLLGKILRIDPRAPEEGRPYSIPPDNPFVGRAGAREEIWAYGLRNPWRFSFDPQTGRLWAGDVGQNSYEEVDLVRRGGNYGWNVMEGLHCFPPSVSSCDRRGLEMPVTEYSLTQGNCSVIGGYVYRGSRLPSLYGAYVYGDFCSGRIWGLRYDGQQVTSHGLLVDSPLQISSFGEDQAGELYILSYEGVIYRLKESG